MLAPMTQDDIENSVLETVAEATVAGTPPARAILGSRGADADPLLEYLLGRGITVFMHDQRARDRLELKILKLDPEHYEKLAAEQAANAARPRSKSAIRRELIAAEKQVQAQERVVGHAKKMLAAVTFYESWKLSDGTALGDATKAVLAAESTKERNISDGHVKNVKFYSALAKKLTGEQTVNDAVPLGDAHKLREKIYAAGA
jgi:hypothetical protein